jgi:hypothetical protein
VNSIWMDRANVLEVLDATPWISGRTAWGHALQPLQSGLPDARAA